MIETIKKQRRRILLFFLLQIILLIGAPILIVTLKIDLLALFTDNTHFLFLFIGLVLLVSIEMFFFFIVFDQIEKKTKLNYINVASTLGIDISEAYSFGQLGLVSYDEQNEIIWTSELFDERDINILGENWTEIYPELNALLIDEKRLAEIEIRSRIYQVRLLPEMKLFMFKDVTDYEALEKSFREGAPLIIQILIDNYQDLVSVRDDDDQLDETISKVKDRLFDYANENGILLSRRRNDAYFGFLNEVNYQKILSDRFSILEEVRQLGTKENPLTLSVGISRGTADMLRLGELSTTALDVALSRGGDQLVVCTHGRGMEFFGGKSEGRGANSKVRTRVLAQAFVAHLEAARQVIIMGHNQADFDAIGAALGVYAICKALNINAKIVYDEKLLEAKTKGGVRTSFTKAQLADMIILPDTAAETAKEEDLLVLVDVHKPSFTMAPELLEKYEKVAIIDHHRRQEEYVNQNVFSLIEPGSSSTSEIIAQFFKTLNQEVEVSPEIATLMLAGIIVDTNNYQRGADARTYESAMILKEYGADIEKAHQFMADEFEEFILRNRILASAITPFFGILIAFASEEDIVTRTLIAKVADQGISVRGINAIFVIGRTKVDEVSLSARSNSQFNVQVIAEQLGGGGHFSGAAAQFKDLSIEEVRQKVIDTLEKYFEEERKK